MRCFWCFIFQFTLRVCRMKLWRKIVIIVLVEQFNYVLDESPVVITLQFLLSLTWDLSGDWRRLEEGKRGKIILLSNPKHSKEPQCVCFLSQFMSQKTRLCLGSETCRFKLVLIVSLGKLNTISGNVFNWNWFIRCQQSSCGSEFCTREWEGWAQWSREQTNYRGQTEQ